MRLARLFLSLMMSVAPLSADEAHDSAATDAGSTEITTAYPYDLQQCRFLKRDKGYYFL